MRLKFEMYGSHCREICSGSCFLHFSDSQNRVAIAAGNVQGIGEFPNERFRIWLAICIARRVCIHGQKSDQHLKTRLKKSMNN